jgi:hypothetical protein
VSYTGLTTSDGGVTAVELPPADGGSFELPASTNALRVMLREGTDPNDYDGDGAPDVIEIEVIVAWKSFDGANAKVSAKRLRAK